MTLPVSSLANMEYALYGGALNGNQNCPNALNGYKASPVNQYGMGFSPYSQNYMNNGMYNNYGYNNANQYSGNNSWGYNQPVFNNPKTQTSKVQKSTNKKDLDKLAKYYEDSNTYVQKWGDIGMSAASIALMENAQTMKHFYNSAKAIKTTNTVFDMSNSAVKNLWTKNPELAQKAYAQLHAINRASGSKLPIIGGWFQKPIDELSRQNLEKIMSDAIKTGDEKAILKATETLKAARGMDGYIPTAWNKINNFFGGKARNYTPYERIKRKAADIDKAVNAPMALKPGLTGLLKQGVKEGKTFALFGMLVDAPKIISAYKNGGLDSALTQTAQTGVRSIADGIGWTLGRAAGTALGTKLGTYIGTAICPGVGTAVGAVIGFLGGAAGSILASKASHLVIPSDEATKLEANNMKKTPEGQVQLLQLVAQAYQSGENVKPDVLQAAQNTATALGA